MGVDVQRAWAHIYRLLQVLHTPFRFHNAFVLVMQVEMAQRVLSSDMTSLVTSMKLALKYSKTLLDAEYRREMLQASHVIAVDSKNLLDTIDMARRLQLYRAAENNVDDDATCDETTTDCTTVAAAEQPSD